MKSEQKPQIKRKCVCVYSADFIIRNRINLETEANFVHNTNFIEFFPPG